MNTMAIEKLVLVECCGKFLRPDGKSFTTSKFAAGMFSPEKADCLIRELKPRGMFARIVKL